MTSSDTQQPSSSGDLLRRTLHQFQIDGYLCDTELVADDGKMKAHAVVLAATSSVFKDALKPGLKLEECVIAVPGIELNLLEIVLCYAYTGELMVSQEHLTEDSLSTILSVLEQLGFELSSVMTRNTEKSASDSDSLAESVPFKCEKVIDDDDGLKNDFDAICKDVIKIVEVPPNECKPLELSVFSDCVDFDSGRQQENLNESCSRKSNEKIVLNPKPVKGNEKIVSMPKHVEISSKGNNSSSNESHTVAKIEDNTVMQSYSNLCDICGEVFDDISKYRTHKMKSHRRRKTDLPVQCQQCGVKFANQPNLRRHMYQHTSERPHLCPHCGEGFIQRRSLFDHLSSRHPDKLDSSTLVPYKCRRCGEMLYNSYLYRQHMKTHPKGNFSIVTARSQADSSTKPYACEQCGRRFALKASLIIHSRLHTDEWALRRARRGRQRKGNNTIHVCKTCGKKFTFQTTLLAHERIHTGEKPFKCTFCGLEMATAHQLHAHLLRHTGETPHTCHVCGKGFRLRANLLSHERTHTGEKPFTCPECGRQVAHAAQLVDHIRIHTGEKPYTCKVCGKQMRQRAHLTTHMRTHTGEKPYGCQLCEKSYKQMADLRFHYRRMHQFELPKDPHRRTLNLEIRTIKDIDIKVLDQLSADSTL